jgi:fucose permease
MRDLASKKTNVMAIVAIFIMMILVAIIENIRGVFIPIFKQDFGINDTTIGVMLTVSSLGYIVFTYIGGTLCEKIGQKKVFILGFIFLITSLGLLGVTYTVPLLLVSMFIMNMGLALTAIATNTLVPVLFLSFQAILMNMTHFCYGLGSTFAQRLAGILIFKGINWRTIYLVEAVLTVILMVIFIFIKIPEPAKDKHKEAIDKSALIKNKLIYFYIAMLGFYVFAEVGTGNWFINFMQKNYKYNENKSSFYLALFFGIFTIGRLLGGFIVEKMGYLNTVLISLIIAVSLFLTGLIIGENGMIVISISGLFFSITFPTVILSIRKVFKKNTAYITGIIMTFGSIINMMMNFLVGRLNDKVGVYYSFYLIPTSLIISIVFLFLIYTNTKESFRHLK